MRTLAEIDYLHGEEDRRQVSLWAAAILGAGIGAGAVLYFEGCFDYIAELDRIGDLGGLEGLVWAGLFLVVSVAVLPVHELIHAAFFRIFGGPGTRVRFGFEAGMLYAGSPGLVLSRGRFVWVLAAPATILSTALLAAGAATGLTLLGYVCFVSHLAGCAGDLYGIWRALKQPGCTHGEDTDSGLRLLGGE